MSKQEENIVRFFFWSVRGQFVICCQWFFLSLFHRHRCGVFGPAISFKQRKEIKKKERKKNSELKQPPRIRYGTFHSTRKKKKLWREIYEINIKVEIGSLSTLANVIHENNNKTPEKRLSVSVWTWDVMIVIRFRCSYCMVCVDFFFVWIFFFSYVSRLYCFGWWCCGCSVCVPTDGV